MNPERCRCQYSARRANCSGARISLPSPAPHAYSKTHSDMHTYGEYASGQVAVLVCVPAERADRGLDKLNTFAFE